MFNVRTTPILDHDFLSSLLKDTSPDKSEIARQIWEFSHTASPTDEAAIASAFFGHLQDEISKIQHHQQLFAFCTFENVIFILGVLQSMSTHTLKEVIEELQKGFCAVDEESIRRTVELCIRLHLTININSRDISVGTLFHRERALDWHHGQSIVGLLDTTFAADHATQKSLMLDGAFNMDFLVNGCGLRMEWTRYLTDHLRLDPQKRVLLVYRHKVYLNNMLKKAPAGPIPLAVLNEALDTLNLLFPFGNPSTQQLLAGHNEKTFGTLGNCGRERILDLSHYRYWRHELEMLLEIYRSPPRTWKQLAIDRRNKLEWSAFWVTVMVAFLTVVSIPCSIIQAVYTVKAYNLALAQGNGIRLDES